jgi:hypothetical protein
MNETNDIILEDSFPGFDDDDFAEETEFDGNQTEEEETAAEEPEVSTEDVQTEEPAAEEQVEQTTAAEETQATQETAEDPDAGLPEKISVKYMKGEMEIAKKDIRATLQKGVDYDRVQNQRDAAVKQMQEHAQWRQENENTLSEIAAVAQAAGMDVPGLLNSLRVNMLVQQGMSREAATERIRAERAERQIEASRQKHDAQQQQETQRQDRARAEFMEFTQRFPGVRIEDVPQSVIQKSANGEMSLANAYLTHLYEQQKAENQRLQQSLAAKTQNENNKQRSLGSVKSSGTNRAKDDFLAGFDD